VVVEQAKPQAKKRIRSPRSGAEIETPNATSFKPNQSGNPEGSSAKARAKAALEKVARSPQLEAVLERLFDIATRKNSKDSDAIQAGRLVSELTGLREDETKLELAVTTTMVFEDRRSGATVKVERVKPKVEVEGGARERPNGEREIEIG
jgi:hypothetical protein